MRPRPPGATTLAALALVAALLGAPRPAAAATVRAGLFVGSSAGDYDEDPLFYAHEDAEKMHRAFLTYGSLDPRLGRVLEDPDHARLSRALGDLGERITLVKDRGDGAHVECVFYYSGHGGADGLHMGGDRYGYRELHRALEALRCDLLVVVLDACQSGEFVRVKGVTFQPEEFRVKLHDTKQGEVFITSSARNEFSQEKDELKGSVFTYHLVNGLLGAADADKDGRVTLAEAYDYTSRKTIQETFGSARGFQVPHYDYRVSGSHDTVLTDLGGKKRRVDVPRGFAGIVTFMDRERGIIWGDFEVEGGDAAVAVPPGQYLVRLRDRGGHLSLSRCTVAADGAATWTRPRAIAAADDPLKGQRVLHRWHVRVLGDALLSSDATLMRDVAFGGRLEILVDNVGIPPVYAGLVLGGAHGARAETVFGTAVESSSQIFRVAALIGLKRRFDPLVELAGDVRLGGGYAVLSRRLRDQVEDATGYLFDAGLWCHLTWWLSRDIALAAPSFGGAIALYRSGDETRATLAGGVAAGLQLAF